MLALDTAVVLLLLAHTLNSWQSDLVSLVPALIKNVLVSLHNARHVAATVGSITNVRAVYVLVADWRLVMVRRSVATVLRAISIIAVDEGNSLNVVCLVVVLISPHNQILLSFLNPYWSHRPGVSGYIDVGYLLRCSITVSSRRLNLT